MKNLRTKRVAGSQFSLQPLEARRLCAATPLVINGTAGNDHIRLDSKDGYINLVRENLVVSRHFVADISEVRVNLLDGSDSFSMSGSFSAFNGFPKKPVIVYGGSGNDDLRGAGCSEKFYGEGGGDTIIGGGGKDYIDGGAHGDKLTTSNGTVKGGDGNDTIQGGNGVSSLYGDAGHDIINGGGGDERLYGGVGFDTMNGGSGRDFMYGGDDADTMNGGAGQDELYGEKGADNLTGGTDRDRLFGGDGNDHIFAARDGWNDGISGGAGTDWAEVDDAPWYAFWEQQDSWSTVENVRKF